MLKGAIVIFCCFSSVLSEGVDEDIAQAPDSSDAFELLQGNGTVKFEMDMILPLDEYVFIQKYGQVGQETRPIEKRDVDLVERYRRKGVGKEERRWPDKTVPYEIRGCFSDSEKADIYSSMADYHRFTCTRWRVAKKSERTMAFFSDHNGGCYAWPGCYHEPQAINLGRGCRKKGTVVHEMGHTLGMYHEQSRPDRDDYITIHKSNMIHGMDAQFHKYGLSTIPNWGVEYDYESVMHYGDKAFSRNRKRTITAKDVRYQSKMGNRIGLAFSDIKMINVMYKCGDHCKNPPRCPGSGFVGKDCRCWCKGKDLSQPIKYCDGSGEPTDPGPEVEQDKNAPTGCPSGTTGTTKPTGPRGKPCKDDASDCRKHYRYCKKRDWHSYMKKSCRRTCGFCKTSSRDQAECEDGNDKCPQFAKQGECTKNLVYMTSVCPRSCGLCDGKTLEVPSVCADTNADCARAAAAGECEVDSVVMHAECPKSCGLCS